MKTNIDYVCPVDPKHNMQLEGAGQTGSQLLVRMHANDRGGVCDASARPVHPSWMPLLEPVKPSTPAPPVVGQQDAEAKCICIDNRDVADCVVHGTQAKIMALERELAKLRGNA